MLLLFDVGHDCLTVDGGLELGEDRRFVDREDVFALHWALLVRVHVGQLNIGCSGRPATFATNAHFLEWDQNLLVVEIGYQLELPVESLVVAELKEKFIRKLSYLSRLLLCFYLVVDLLVCRSLCALPCFVCISHRKI